MGILLPCLSKRIAGLSLMNLPSCARVDHLLNCRPSAEPSSTFLSLSARSENVIYFAPHANENLRLR